MPGWSLDQKSKEILSKVHPDLEAVVYRAAQISPIPFRVIEGLRTLTRQRQLKAQGLSKTLNSRHLTGHAVDIVPIVDLNGDGKIDGEEMWHHSQLLKLSPYIKQAFKTNNTPYEWGGDWRNAWDKPHWQLPWKQYPIRTASLAGGELDEAFADPVMETPVVTPNAARTIGETGAGVGGLAILTDAVTQFQSAEQKFNSSSVFGFAIGSLMIMTTLVMLYDRWDSAGRPLPRWWPR
jgi:peptidoglycan LD-endopeptidase CwlK